jgi:hypothetical protein
MKKFTLIPVLAIAFSLVYSFSTKKVNFDEIAVGTALPQADFKMKDVSGKEISLGDVKTAKGILVIFSCNTCPKAELKNILIFV